LNGEPRRRRSMYVDVDAIHTFTGARCVSSSNHHNVLRKSNPFYQVKHSPTVHISTKKYIFIGMENLFQQTMKKGVT